jgi:hypothetical protein
MLPLYLLASHMAGDYLLQTRWQAATKLTDPWVRSLHVLGYTAAFIPAAAVAGVPWQEAVTFLGFLAALHWLTDSRRIRSTLGDWLEWQTMSDRGKIDEHERVRAHPTLGAVRIRHKTADGLKLPPNPWEPMPILIDQSLHLIQIAVLAGWLLT